MNHTFPVDLNTFFFYQIYIRHGLIKARLAGARLAKGDILMFLDAHCECTNFWLEPLVDRISNNPHTVVTPLIDVIDYKNFKYEAGDITDGTFDVRSFKEN